jgi:NDP-sugar pyrophosphorylase family protein
MIEHCVPPNWEERVIVVCKLSELRLFNDALPLYWITPIHSIGQANSVYEGSKGFHDTGDILVINSDNGFKIDLHKFVDECRKLKATAGAVVFKSDGSNAYGYIDRKPIFNRAVEHTAISPFALAGAFYFQSKIVLETAYELVSINDRNKMYGTALSALFEMIPLPKLAYEIRRDDLHVWGTAEDLLADTSVQVP